MVSNGPLHSTLIEDANVDDSVLNAVEWHEYSEAAVRRHQQLASLNQRLSRLLEFANDVVRPRHEHSSNPPSPSRNKGSVDESGISLNSRSRSRSSEALTADLFKTTSIEEEIEEKTRIFRNSVQLCDVRIDTVRRAMKAVSEKNEELMQENRELRILNSETEAEVQRLKDENEKLQKKNRELITRTPPPVDHRACQESIKSLQLENRTLKGRLEQHKHLLRKGLDDFISRSVEALQNGTPHLTAYENHVFTSNTGDDDDKKAIRTEKSKSTVQSDVVPKEQVTQLEDELKTLTNELEYERFYSKRKINRLQEKLDQLSENLRRKEAELQKIFGELETALKTLQALITAGDDTEKEVDTYRCLLEEAEFQLLESSDDSSGFSSSLPVYSFGSSYSSSSEDETTESCNSLEIKRQDVRKGEYIVLQNKGEEPLDMSRWYIVQQCGNKKVTHQLPTPFIMKPKSRVVMWSADAKTSHISPVNYVMSETVLPWCESGEADLITKVYDLLGNVDRLRASSNKWR